MKWTIPAVIVAFALAGCGSSATTSTPAAQPSATATARPTSSPAAATPHQIGDSVLVGGPNGEAELAKYLVLNPHTDASGRFALDISIENAPTSDDVYTPGTWVLLTDGGTKLDAWDRDYVHRGTGKLDITGYMVAGERRQGWVSFDVPQGQKPAKLYLYHGELAGPVGIWTLK